MYKTSKMSLQMLSLEELNTFNIIKPDCQRAVDPDQINKIYEYQIRHFEKYNEFFFANPILFRRCTGSVLQNAMKKIAHNQTRDPGSLSDFSRLVLEGGLGQYSES